MKRKNEQLAEIRFKLSEFWDSWGLSLVLINSLVIISILIIVGVAAIATPAPTTQAGVDACITITQSNQACHTWANDMQARDPLAFAECVALDNAHDIYECINEGAQK